MTAARCSACAGVGMIWLSTRNDRTGEGQDVTRSCPICPVGEKVRRSKAEMHEAQVKRIRAAWRGYTKVQIEQAVAHYCPPVVEPDASQWLAERGLGRRAA